MSKVNFVVYDFHIRSTISLIMKGISFNIGIRRYDSKRTIIVTRSKHGRLKWHRMQIYHILMYLRDLAEFHPKPIIKQTVNRTQR